MRLDDMEVLGDIDGGVFPVERGDDRRGLCSLGEALHELLANYPISIELEPLPDESWASPEIFTVALGS